VTDARGLPLEGASVTVKGRTQGITTDKGGKYVVTAEPGAVLTFSYTGLLSREESIDSRTMINVTLQENPAALENVVVVGYGSQRKVNLTGAVAQVSGRELINRPVPNVTGALQGVLPGVTVIRGSGKPGDEGYGVRIRGFSSANSASALVLVA
jgi:outer membrane receptor protein involved in Fe transport